MAAAIICIKNTCSHVPVHKELPTARIAPTSTIYGTYVQFDPLQRAGRLVPLGTYCQSVSCIGCVSVSIRAKTVGRLRMRLSLRSVQESARLLCAALLTVCDSANEISSAIDGGLIRVSLI